MKFSEEFKIYFPQFTREMAAKAGLKVMETKEPSLLLDGKFLFLGEVPKRSDFEKGMLRPTVWRTMSRNGMPLRMTHPLS